MIAASAVWPLAALGAFLAIGIATHLARWRLIWSIPFMVVMVLAIFVGPPIWKALRYDHAAALASSMIGIATLLLGGCVDGVAQRRRLRPYREFRARFSAGPVGRWRTLTFEELPDPQPGCEVIFAANSQGRFRQWKTLASEGESPWKQFCWRLIEAGNIEIETNVQLESRQKLICHFPEYGRYLILWKKELFDQLINLGDSEDHSREHLAACQWPGDYFFAHEGPPVAQSGTGPDPIKWDEK
jgi:hypothetical protein